MHITDIPFSPLHPKHKRPSWDGTFLPSKYNPTHPREGEFSRYDCIACGETTWACARGLARCEQAGVGTKRVRWMQEHLFGQVSHLLYCVRKTKPAALSCVGARFSPADKEGIPVRRNLPLSPGEPRWLNRLSRGTRQVWVQGFVALLLERRGGFGRLCTFARCYFSESFFKWKGTFNPTRPVLLPGAVCAARGRIGPRYFYKREKSKQTKSTDGNPQMEGDILVIYLKSC